MKDKIYSIVVHYCESNEECEKLTNELFDLFGVSHQRELLQKIESVKNFEWGISPVNNKNRMCELIKLL